MTSKDRLDPHEPAEKDYHEQLLVLEQMLETSLSSQNLSPADIAKINRELAARALSTPRTRITEIVESPETSQP